MAQIHRLNPHDPLPDSRFIAVLRRFDEDDPQRVMVEMVLSRPGHGEHTSRPQRADGFFMEYEEAIEAASRLADEDGIAVYAIDRTAGPRESAILAHGGDHSVGMDTVQDMDLEEGERGPDMRRA